MSCVNSLEEKEATKVDQEQEEHRLESKLSSNCDLLLCNGRLKFIGRTKTFDGISESEDGRRKEALNEVEKGREHAKWWLRTRIHMALIALAIATVNCYAQATFCIAIVEMVVPADYMAAAPATVAITMTDLTSNQRIRNNSNPSMSQLRHPANDESCPIEFKYRNYYDSWRFPSISAEPNAIRKTNLPSTATIHNIDVSNRLHWDASKQGLLLGAFAFGTIPFQVVGGRLAEIHGAKWILLVACIGTALTNLSIPFIAHRSFVLLMVNRVVMGAAQAGTEPGLMCFLAEWLTPSEAGFFISMLLFAMCIGYFLGSLLSSFILALGYGWPFAYYVSGALNLAVGLAWLWYADSWPRASKYISIGELAFIRSEQTKVSKSGFGQQRPQDPTISSPLESATCSMSSLSTSTTGGALVDNVAPLSAKPADASIQISPTQSQCTKKQPLDLIPSAPAPWLNILSTPSVWAFIICKISIRWCADVLGNELPTYLANVLHLSIEINGILNSVSSALFAIFSFLTGWLVNEIISKESYQNEPSKTKVRKIFQSIASFGSALAVFLMTHYDCEILFSMSMLLVLSCCIVMGSGGELQIPYDMTTRYPGTLHGMACTLSVSGWLAPPLIGLILGDKPSSRQRWHSVWYLTATINLIGGLVFLMFADASPRDFDAKKSQEGGEFSKSGGYETAEYANAACSPIFACNDSPRLRPEMADEENNHDQQQQQQTKPPLYFDEKLLKFRQSPESTLVPASYPAYHLSPLAGLELMLPFEEKDKRRRRQQQQQSSNSRNPEWISSSKNGNSSVASRAISSWLVASLWRQIDPAPDTTSTERMETGNTIATGTQADSGYRCASLPLNMAAAESGQRQWWQTETEGGSRTPIEKADCWRAAESAKTITHL